MLNGVLVRNHHSSTPLLQHPIQFCLFVIALVSCNHLSSAFSYSALVMQYLGRQKAIEYFKRLAQQDLVLINGHSNQAMLLTAGEFPIIIYSDIARTEELKRKGAPIEWVRTEPHITVLVSAAITREARHPAAARLFMNFAEIYDCFTITTMITLEDYGFCKKGEGKDFVKNGRIEVGGELPVNTHGGLLSQAHIEGMLHVTEAVRQLRGNEVEPERQVRDAKVGIVSGHGGSLCMHASLILGAL